MISCSNFKFFATPFSAIALILLFGCGQNTATSEMSNPYHQDSSTPDNSQPFKLTCLEAQLLKTINLYREQNGLSHLLPSKVSTLASRWHAQNMNDLQYFSHTEPSGRTFSQRGSFFGFNVNGENILAGTGNVNSAFCGWKNSAGHNANMLNTNFKFTGLGFYNGNYLGGTWSHNFSNNLSDGSATLYSPDSSCNLPNLVPACN